MNNDEIKKAMIAAGVAPSSWSTKITNYGKTGETLRNYLLTNFKDDLVKGAGIFINGDSDIRVPFFNTLAKEIVLLKPGKVVLVSMRKLVNAIIHNDYEERKNYIQSRVLMLKNFYDASVECPYTYMERSLVEDFLGDRVEENKSMTVYSSCAPLESASWWSRDFRKQITLNSIVNFYVK